MSRVPDNSRPAHCPCGTTLRSAKGLEVHLRAQARPFTSRLVTEPAVRYKIGFEDSVPSPAEAKTACPSCRSASVIGFGVRHNRSGEVRTFRCNDCGSRFSGREGFRNRRADPEKIALALGLYFRGMSVRKVAEHFRQAQGLDVSHVTVYRWGVHFGRLAAQWMDTQGARTSDRWHIDETVVNIGGDNRYLWNVLDHESRFALATHISRGRDLTNTRLPIHKAKRATPDRPMEVFTDGMNSYPRAVRRELSFRVGDRVISPHHRVPSIRAPESNNRIERLHGSEKERIKVMRGFDTDKGTAALMEGFRTHYNLIRTHQALGTTPAVAAGFPELPGFKWYELLKRAAPQPKAGYPELEIIPN